MDIRLMAPSYDGTGKIVHTGDGNLDDYPLPSIIEVMYMIRNYNKE